LSDSLTSQYFPSDRSLETHEAEIHQRKRDHISLCHTGEVSIEGDAGLWAQLRLVHCALPELKLSELDLSASLLGRELPVPVMATGMTGGPPEAGEINRSVARVCERFGLPFGVGSQRVITKDPSSLETFQVRRAAPDVFLIANLGVNQLRDLGTDRARELVRSIEADALAVHLNPAMEVVQPGQEADSDFSGGYEAIARVVEALDGQVIVKECGCGLSPEVVRRLYAVGVQAVDLSGVGGTSWVKLEALRAEGSQAALGMSLADWGIPTAAATLMAHEARAQLGAESSLKLVASGGIQSPLQAVKALALGADLVGVARPLLQALLNGGEEAAERYVEALINGIRQITMLTGARAVRELRSMPRVVGPGLEAWRAIARAEDSAR